MLANLRIYQRIVLAVALPVVLLIGLAGYNLAERWQTHVEMTKLETLGQAVANLSRSIHELQRERGGSAVFIGSKGAQMKTELVALRKRTDETRAAAMAGLKIVGADGNQDLKQAIGKAEAAIGDLDARRKAIDALSIPASESSAYFTDTILKLLAVSTDLASATTEAEVGAAINAYVGFMQGKERAGQERAQGAGAVSAGRFDQTVYARVLGLGAAQQIYFAMFEAAAKPEQRAFFRTTMSGPVNDAVVKMRQIIMEGGLAGDLKGLDGKAWFDATTARIDLLKTVEDRLATDLAALTNAKESAATQALLALAGLVAIALLASLAMTMVMARSITAPLGKLSCVMKTLAEGDTSVIVEGEQRKDEIGTMARAVQFFKDSMIKTQALTASEAEAMRERSERAARVASLTESFDKAMASVLRSVSAASTELEATARSMSGIASETSRQAANVATSSTQATDNVQTVAAAAEEMTGSVGEISRQVTQSSAVARKAVEEADRTNRTVVGLSESAEKIGGVVKLINDIAGQTNLLALNATIEAARAGEAGKGFAVVASEVKTLADQTAKATGEISTQITAIQDASADAVQAIQAITTTINEISEITSSIASAVTEQSAATAEIARNVQQAAIGTSEIAKSISGVTEATEQTGAAAQQVLTASQELSQQSEAMRAEVEGFLGNIRAA
jgi:methyl-accepting chemotaxis protein